MAFPLQFSPGTRFLDIRFSILMIEEFPDHRVAYTNLGYCALALIIEQVWSDHKVGLFVVQFVHFVFGRSKTTTCPTYQTLTDFILALLPFLPFSFSDSFLTLVHFWPQGSRYSYGQVVRTLLLDEAGPQVQLRSKWKCKNIICPGISNVEMYLGEDKAKDYESVGQCGITCGPRWKLSTPTSLFMPILMTILIL